MDARATPRSRPAIGLGSAARASSLALLLAACATAVAQARLHAPADRSRAHSANVSHAGWPAITGMLLMNRANRGRPLDGRPGFDPFDHADRSYSCNEITRYTGCRGGTFFPSHARSAARDLVPARVAREHNELLGGNGSDAIHAGPAGDVIWGDYQPHGQPTSQVDRLFGGPGDDWIYASHGLNLIWTGGGRDHIMLEDGHGAVHCDGPGRKTIELSRSHPHRYRLIGCAGASVIPFRG